MSLREEGERIRGSERSACIFFPTIFSMSAADFEWRECVTHAKLADEYVSKATR